MGISHIKSPSPRSRGLIMQGRIQIFLCWVQIHFYTHHLQLLSTLLPAQYAINFTKCCTCWPGPGSGRKTVFFSKLLLHPGLFSSSGSGRLKYHLGAHLCRCFLPCCRQHAICEGRELEVSLRLGKAGDDGQQLPVYPRLRSSPRHDIKASS